MVAETDRSGFTLVEMLVSLAVTALIAVLLIQLLQATGMVTRRARQASVQEEVQVVREHLRRTLAEAVRRRGDGKRVPFTGLRDRLVVVVAADRDVERGSEMRIDLTMVERPDRPGLALIESRILTSGTGPAGDPDILLDGIAGLRLRYFGVPAQGSQPGWQPNWSRADRLPALVEVAVDFPAADPRRWGALVIPVGAGS